MLDLYLEFHLCRVFVRLSKVARHCARLRNHTMARHLLVVILEIEE
jgi:hypothetical protein